MKKNLLFLVLILSLSGAAQAQVNNEFQIANRLMQQQRYQEALPFLERITNKQPEVFLFFDRYVECIIQLKEYDRALTFVEQAIARNRNVAESNILLGTLYHIKGDTTMAYEIWENNLELNPSQLQLYLSTAKSMIDRKAFKKAINVYKKGRLVFNNDQLFMSDIPNAYMQAGEYENAVLEWLELIKKNPQQITGIQRMLLRYNDPILYDVSIIELEDQITQMTTNNPSYTSLYELQIWLLLENNLYRRAFSTAKEFEEKTSSFNFSLFNVSRQLLENNEFELALSGFDYYSQNSFGEIKWRAEEEKANVLTFWAKFLDDYSLDLAGKKDSLFQEAVSILDNLIFQTQTYSRVAQVYLKKAELSLDYVHDLEEAKSAIRKFKSQPTMNDTPESNYLDGRVFLAQKEYTSARISFTRSNKKADIGEMAEKTRYFLALTDFYAGDFEFAKIQLKTLGRQNTSYYANDALELRLWVQEGTSADTTGEQLSIFAKAIQEKNAGDFSTSIELLDQFIKENPSSPLYDDALLHLVQLSSSKVPALEDFVFHENLSPLKEQFLWMLATSLENFTAVSCDEQENDCVERNTTYSQYELLEKIIMDYPQGFYAPYARKRLSELPNPNS